MDEVGSDVYLGGFGLSGIYIGLSCPKREVYLRPVITEQSEAEPFFTQLRNGTAAAPHGSLIEGHSVIYDVHPDRKAKCSSCRDKVSILGWIRAILNITERLPIATTLRLIRIGTKVPDKSAYCLV
jgi:hypothetical protein